jgi:hypothetical protein
MGKYNGFEALEARIANNKFDSWDRDYYTVAKIVRDVSDSYMEEKLDGALPGMRSRALLLLKGGNINPCSIQCCNVTSKIDNSSCLLLRCEALSDLSSIPSMPSLKIRRMGTFYHPHCQHAVVRMDHSFARI